MIQKTQSYQSSDGAKHDTLDAAKLREIDLILLEGQSFQNSDAEEAFKTYMRRAADAVLKHADRIKDVLTTVESSIPAARAINGGRKPRKGKTPPAPPNKDAGQTFIPGTEPSGEKAA